MWSTKMRKKIVILTAVVVFLVIGVMAASVLAADLMLSQNIVVSKRPETTLELAASENLASVREETSLTSVYYDDIPTSITPSEVEEQIENDVDNLQETVPGTYEEADALVSNLRIRFLLYTHDGKHIMWGFVGNGYFVGKDNLGKRCWGIYGKGVFAGFYDGEFFWGKYQCAHWKAIGLFGKNYTHGKYILFPEINLEPAITASTP